MSDRSSSHSLLKGNFKPQQEVFLTSDDGVDATEEFERKALAKLGGSTCFVRKKSFVFDPERESTDA